MVFFRLLQGILRRWPDTPILAASVPSIFVTFVLMGVWHGNGLNWLLYGCYHGVALSGELLYRAAMERFCPDLYDRLIASRPYRWACVFLMFNFVAWGLLLTEPLADLARLLARIGG
jgi:D-alanyl-lipoteichoic acid acyltransferase DltB (MBOAT superfamily)